MLSTPSDRMLGAVLTVLLILALGITPSALAQHGSEGTVTVTVLDPSGSVVSGAQLELRDTATNEVRKGETQDGGTHTFVDLSLGKYKLRVSKTGFQTQIFTDVVAEAARTTDISATLKVGAINETVEVTGGSAPLVETSTNMIGTTIDMHQIEDLPIQGRDLTQLSQLIPGYTGGQTNEGGTWNGLPAIDQGNNVDGVIGSSSRMKFGGNAAPAISPRLESIEEMTVQTEQLDMNQGFGQASMQINFVTRRGGNAFHGRVFEDFRNAVLNAQSWYNDTANYLDPSNPLPKNPIKLNDFGGSIGGPLIKNKLFVFGTFSESRQPGVVGANNWLLTSAAQSGVFTYVGTDGNTHTVNLYTLAQNQGINRALSPATAAVFSAYPSLSGVTVTPAPNGDPNVQQITWQVSNPTTYYYPAVRVDYTPTDKMRFNVAWNMTKFHYPVNGTAYPDFPGSTWSNTGGGVVSKNYTAAFGFDYTVSPTIVNDFRGGFLYNWSLYGAGAAPLSANIPQVGWDYPGAGGVLATQMSGTVDYVPTGTYYPIFNASDTVTWQHHAHNVSFGFSWYQEQDHYYNGVQGFPVVTMGLANGDPTLTKGGGAFTTTTIPDSTQTQTAVAQQLYAILTGTISGVNGQYAYDPQSKQFYTGQLNAYNLDELQRAWALHFQDSYRLRPNLTLNYGLRWDFTGADHDLTGLYHSATPAAIFGPSGINNLFNPGSLHGDLNPVIAERPTAYNSWNVSPQPAVGIAWNPHGGDGWFGQKLMGGDRTVIRAGISLKKFTEPQQYFWNQASDGGSFYYQSFNLFANSNSGPSNFVPGSFLLTTPSLPSNNTPFQLPAGNSYALSPQTFQVSEAMSDFTFVGGPGANGINPNIQQPYTESWNLGIQRQLGESRALEIRYVGNRTLRQWMYEDINEVNIFQSGPFGVLTNVKAAQTNLAINNASNNPNYQGSFANHGLPGQQATPLFDAAFAGPTELNPPCPDGLAADYCSSNLATMVGTGQAGAIGGVLDNNNGTAPYFCNLVGSSFGPCANALNGVNYTGAGAGLPMNFLQANPYAAGNPALYLVAEGYSNYNGLQVDLRQKQWHGLQFDANYTWSHSLGLTTPNNWQGQTYTFTLRDMRLGYGPSLFDIRHSMNLNGTYDLPFGRGRSFVNHGGVLDKVVGGWTLGTIFNFQTGTPFLLGGGSGNGNPTTASTFNNDPNADGLGDGGVVLHGVTVSQLQKSIGVYHIPGQTTVDLIGPKYLANNGAGGGANPAYITPNTTAGTIGQRVWLYGPRYWNDDLSITKHFPIRENIQFILQSEMLNVFNHPNFQPGPGSGCNYYCNSAGYQFPFIQGSGFGIGGISPNYNAASPNQGARVIELRANIEF
jgi:hypothetical protein